MSYSDKQVTLMEENRQLSDEVARLRALLLRIRPEMHCMSSQLRASGYRDGATLREVLADLEAALTPQAGKGGGA